MLQLPQLVQGFQGLAAVDDFPSMVAQLFPLGGQGLGLLPKVSILDEALVVEPLESVGLLIQVRQGRVQLIELGVALLLPGGDLFQEGESGGEECIPMGI